jgi:hypothetical protein
MTPSLDSNITNIAQQITSLMAQGVKCIHDAATLLVQQLDDGQLVLNDLHEADTRLSMEVLHMLERIGRKQLLPELAIPSGLPGEAALARMPYSTQKLLYGRTVEVLVMHADGPSTLNTDIRHLTNHQAKQVFGASGVRDISAQRAYLESNKRSGPTVRGTTPYIFVGRRLIVKRGADLSEADVVQMIKAFNKHLRSARRE